MQITQIKHVLKYNYHLVFYKKKAIILAGISMGVFLLMNLFCGFMPGMYSMFEVVVALMALQSFNLPFFFNEDQYPGERRKVLASVEKKLCILGESRRCFLQVCFFSQMAEAIVMFGVGFLETFVLSRCCGISSVKGYTLLAWAAILYFSMNILFLVLNIKKMVTGSYIIIIGVCSFIGGIMGSFYSSAKKLAKGIPLSVVGIFWLIYLAVFAVIYLNTVIHFKRN